MNSIVNVARHVLLTALGLAACAGAGAVELVGFRGVPWGAEPDSVEPAQLVSAHGEYRCYKRERENMLWGESPLAEVRFCFHRDRFYMAELESKTDVYTLATEFKSMYGAPTVEAPTRVEWGNRYGSARAEIFSAGPEGTATMRLTSNEFEPRQMVSSSRR